MASCTSCLLSRSSNCCSQHFCDVCTCMFRMDWCNGHNNRCSNCVFKVYAFCHHCSTVHEVPHRIDRTMLCLSKSSLSNTISRQSDQLKWSKIPFDFHVHHCPPQLTVPCKTIGALDLTDATHTKCQKNRFTCMFKAGDNPLDAACHFLSSITGNWNQYLLPVWTQYINTLQGCKKICLAGSVVSVHGNGQVMEIVYFVLVEEMDLNVQIWWRHVWGHIHCNTKCPTGYQ